MLIYRIANGSLDRLICARKYGRRDGNPKRLGGLEIDHKLVFGRCLHRQVAGLLALEDAIDIAGRLPKLIEEICPNEIKPPASTNWRWK